MYHPKAKFENNDFMEPVNLTQLSEKDYDKKCSHKKCYKRGGCIPCKKKTCYNFIHATCAQKSFYLREVEKKGALEFEAYCPTHGEELSINKVTLSPSLIKRTLRERSFLDFQIKAKVQNAIWIECKPISPSPDEFQIRTSTKPEQTMV